MDKIIKLILIILLSILVVGLSFFLYKFIQGDYSFDFSVFSNQSNTLVETKVFDSINDINIKSDVADIYINNNTDNNYKVEIYSDTVKNYSIDNTTESLNISFENKANIFFAKTSRIVLYIPSTYNKNMIVNSITGDISVESFDLANLNIESNTGDSDIKSINTLNVKNNTGDIEVVKVNDITIDNRTGDVEVNNINKKLNIKTKTGDVKIDSINILEDSYIESDIGDVKIDSINDIYVETDSKIGDVKVNNENRFSQITLNIKSNVGDIKVN